jgi:hypothetical protein
MQRFVHGRQLHWANGNVLDGVVQNEMDELKELCTMTSFRDAEIRTFETTALGNGIVLGCFVSNDVDEMEELCTVEGVT